MKLTHNGEAFCDVLEVSNPQVIQSINAYALGSSQVASSVHSVFFHLATKIPLEEGKAYTLERDHRKTVIESFAKVAEVDGIFVYGCRAAITGGATI